MIIFLSIREDKRIFEREICIGIAITMLAIDPVHAAERLAVRSPDGCLTAYIRAVKGHSGASGAPATALWLKDNRTGISRKLYQGHMSTDPEEDRSSLANPDFSLDGGHVYVEADGYATSPAVHEVNVRTRVARYVTDGALYGVLRNGQWRGYLVVQQHRYRKDGNGSYDPFVIVRRDGRQIAVVPGTDASNPDRGLIRWLRVKGWAVS